MAPEKFTLQYWTGKNWADVTGLRATPKKPLANGENKTTFRPVTTSKLRILFTSSKPAAVALVELKAFE